MAIGYACMTLGVYKTGIHSCIAKNADDERLREITRQNLEALERMIDFNIESGILLFRISSDIIPFGGHPLNTQKWWKEHEDKFKILKAKIASSGMRVSMHPGQYTVLNSPKEDVVVKSIQDLVYHDRFLTALGVGSAHKMIIHIGGVYGDKVAATKRFIENYSRLSDSIKSRLVIENDEKCYAAKEVYAIGKSLGAPVVFDILHHRINAACSKRTIKEWIELCSQTWKEKDGVPKIHYSQQAQGERTGAHSQTIGLEEFLSFYQDIQSLKVDIMLEVKDKNISAVKCSYAARPNKVLKKQLEQEWARYKYLVLSKSASIYMQMRQLMKKSPNEVAQDFYALVEQAGSLPLDKGACQNAALHVWGYFKDECTTNEKNSFHKKLENFMQSEIGDEALKNYLWKMAEKYEQNYLLNSYYFIK